MESALLQRKSQKKACKAHDTRRYKYIDGSSTQGQGFADIRKRKILLDYKKVKRKEGSINSASKHIYEDKTSVDDTQLQKSRGHQSKFHQKKVSRFSSAEWKYKKKSEEKRKKAEEAARQKREREAAMERYKAKKKERHLKLCKRTSRGQPVLHNQMQILLEKLERQHKTNMRS